MIMNTPLGDRELPDELLNFQFTYCTAEDLSKPRFRNEGDYTVEWNEVNGRAVTTIRLVKK